MEYIPGGATQNTIRVAQWMLGGDKKTGYMGCVGNDARADRMQDIMDKLGVEARYLRVSRVPESRHRALLISRSAHLTTSDSCARS